MGQSIRSNSKPSYEQLEETIRRKDNLISGLYWNMEGLRAAAWLAHHAYESGQPGYSEDEYAGTASHLFRFLAEQTRAVHDGFSEAHRVVFSAVMAGSSEAKEADHA